jgi:hypothetical protein
MLLLVEEKCLMSIYILYFSPRALSSRLVFTPVPVPVPVPSYHCSPDTLALCTDVMELRYVLTRFTIPAILLTQIPYRYPVP